MKKRKKERKKWKVKWNKKHTTSFFFIFLEKTCEEKKTL